jgi:hypothetical protein
MSAPTHKGNAKPPITRPKSWAKNVPQGRDQASPPEACGVCGNTGEVTRDCSICSGTGNDRQTCGACYGTRFKLGKKEICAKCSGTGNIDETCSFCTSGTVKERCNVCRPSAGRGMGYSDECYSM